MNIQENKEEGEHRVSSDKYLPLELTKSYHIYLWSEDRSYKWTIDTSCTIKKVPILNSLEIDPFGRERVDWSVLKNPIKLGQSVSKHFFDASDLK